MSRKRATVVTGTIIESRHERLGKDGTGTLPEPGPAKRASDERARQNRASNGGCQNPACGAPLEARPPLCWRVEVTSEINSATWIYEVPVCSLSCAHQFIAHDRRRREQSGY